MLIIMVIGVILQAICAAFAAISFLQGRKAENRNHPR
jgi:hypothetical protein